MESLKKHTYLSIVFCFFFTKSCVFFLTLSRGYSLTGDASFAIKALACLSLPAVCSVYWGNILTRYRFFRHGFSSILILYIIALTLIALEVSLLQNLWFLIFFGFIIVLSEVLFQYVIPLFFLKEATNAISSSEVALSMITTGVAPLVIGSLNLSEEPEAMILGFCLLSLTLVFSFFFLTKNTKKPNSKRITPKRERKSFKWNLLSRTLKLHFTVMFFANLLILPVINSYGLIYVKTILSYKSQVSEAVAYALPYISLAFGCLSTQIIGLPSKLLSKYAILSLIILILSGSLFHLTGIIYFISLSVASFMTGILIAWSFSLFMTDQHSEARGKLIGLNTFIMMGLPPIGMLIISELSQHHYNILVLNRNLIFFGVFCIILFSTPYLIASLIKSR